MHACDLAQLAGLVAYHGPVFLRTSPPLAADRLEPYWVACRSRQERWWRVFRAVAAPQLALPSRGELMAALEEVLLGEILTRVWTALLVALDRRHNQLEASPIARSVFLGHQEARQRTLQLMLHGPAVPTEQAVILNRLRRRAERWTDMLIGFLMAGGADGELAFDTARAADFAADIRQDHLAFQHGQAWPLMFTSLQTAFQHKLAPQGGNFDLNERVAAGILGCLGRDTFDDFGLARSLWMVRLQAMTTDTQGLLDELLALEFPPAVREANQPALPPQGQPKRRF